MFRNNILCALFNSESKQNNQPIETFYDLIVHKYRLQTATRVLHCSNKLRTSTQ